MSLFITISMTCWCWTWKETRKWEKKNSKIFLRAFKKVQGQGAKCIKWHQRIFNNFDIKMSSILQRGSSEYIWWKNQLKQWGLETCNGVLIKKFKSMYMECCIKWTRLHYNNMRPSSLCVSWDFEWNWTNLPWWKWPTPW
jgi:hypothetical protein